jgi:hypothetical protein
LTQRQQSLGGLLRSGPPQVSRARSGRAHCYLIYGGIRIEVTWFGADPMEPITRFLHEEAIAPEQMGAYKVTLHRQCMQKWVRNNPETVTGQSFQDLWQIREECITASA